MKQLRALQMMSCALILGACTFPSGNDDDGSGGGPTSDDDGGGGQGATGGTGGQGATGGDGGQGATGGQGGQGGLGGIGGTGGQGGKGGQGGSGGQGGQGGQGGDPNTCDPGTFRCQNADSVESCGADGTWSGNTMVCPAICSNGACMPASGIAAGAHHTCARFPDGHVRCWGRNDLGQLGHGTTSAQGVDPPVEVSNLFDVEAIILGGHSSFAIDDDHKVLAWGANGHGQLGLGHSNPQLTPEDVTPAFGATSLDAGQTSTCAVLADATVACWGDNADGLLGTTDGAAAVTTPSAVAGLTGVTDVAVGLGHRCALLANQTVACWGANDVGQLGQGATGSGTATPTVVPGLTGVVSVDIGAGGRHTCAALSDGSVQCWGSNASGQLGQGNLGGMSASPTPTILSFSGVYEVVLGSHHSCARSSISANAYCWGENGYGQLGQGHNGDEPWPQGLSQNGIVDLALGGSADPSSGHSCTLHSGGSIACAGDNQWRQLSDGAYTGVMQNSFVNVSFWHEDFLNP